MRAAFGVAAGAAFGAAADVAAGVAAGVAPDGSCRSSDILFSRLRPAPAAKLDAPAARLETMLKRC